jgi:predicted RNase H-like HicB family nuclease
MSAKSKKSSAAKGIDQKIDRPFDRAILKRAREISSQYGFIVRPEPEVGYLARGLELPNVMGDGRTIDRCIRQIRHALLVTTAYLLESGQVPPPPAEESRRHEQINIRVTAEEKALLEEAARSKGFRGISDFVRSTTLAGVH